MIKFTERTYVLKGITEILGSQPADPEIRSRFIASKAPAEELSREELELIDASQMEIDRGVTKFHQSWRSGALCLLDYQIKGHLKESITNLGSQSGIKQGAKKVDNYVFVLPREIEITQNGKTVTEPDGVCERPLRANVMGREYNSLAASEQIDAPWEIKFNVRLVENSGTRASAPVTWEDIEDALEYGFFKGIGQWRNGGHGRYNWERVDVE